MTKPYIQCPKCKSKAVKLYTKEKAEELANGNPKLELAFKREYQCTNKQCSHVFKVSLMQVTKAFVKKSLDEGNTPIEIMKEIDEVKQGIVRLENIEEKEE